MSKLQKLAEIEGLDDRSPVIPLVTSTRDNCLGAECPEYRACHVMQARREAMAAGSKGGKAAAAKRAARGA